MKLASLGLVVSGICISLAVHFAQVVTICRPWWPRGRFQVKTEAQRLFSPAVHNIYIYIYIYYNGIVRHNGDMVGMCLAGALPQREDLAEGSGDLTQI